MRAEPGHAAVEIAVETLLEGGGRRRVAVVAELRIGEAELAGPLREGRTEEGERLLAGGDEIGAEERHLLGPGCERIAGRVTARDAPERCVPLRDGRTVLRGK